MPNEEFIKTKPKILIICDFYLPGYKSGGGMRTLVNMVERFHNIYEFCIITRDHDGKIDRQPYLNVKINEWNTIHHSKVFYLSKNKIRISKLRELIIQTSKSIVKRNIPDKTIPNKTIAGKSRYKPSGLSLT
jgi:hypothetical protein